MRVSPTLGHPPCPNSTPELPGLNLKCGEFSIFSVVQSMLNAFIDLKVTRSHMLAANVPARNVANECQ